MTKQEIKKEGFWELIDNSLAQRSDWINQLDAIAQHSVDDYTLKDIIAFDDWLKALIKNTSPKLENPILTDFIEINSNPYSLECFIILLGSENYNRIMGDVSLLIKENYLQEYQKVYSVIDNVMDTPEYIFFWRTGKQMKDYRNNPEALTTLQEEIDNNPHKRYH